MTTRRRFLQAMATAPAATVPSRPNVLFLLTDDQRQDTISALSNPNIQTPNLDTLVRSGVTFTNAYCMGGFSAAVCLPSRMMIQRGCSWFTVQKQQPGYPHLAKTMNEAGYLTYHLGKRGNEDTASHQSYQHNYYVEPNDDAERKAAQPFRRTADRVIGFLDQWKAEPKRKPFFMYLADPSPHDPRLAPPEYLARYDAARLPLPPNFLPYHPFDNGEMLIRDERLAPWPRTEAEIRRHLRDYYAVITHMDEQIGRVLAKLKSIGEYDNTLIVFTSDQGIAIGSHGLMGKQNLYEHSMRSGLIVSGPGIPKGRKTDAFAYLFDIYPTLCDLVGTKAPESLEGRSLAPVLRGRRASVRDTVFLAYRGVQRAVRRGPWKLIRYPEIDRTQLFNLAADPFETKDLAGAPEQKARIAEMMALLVAEQKRYGDVLPLRVENPRKGDIGIDFFQGK